MFIGIDVGGTFTDAVLLDRGMVRATAKVVTRQDLLSSLLEALDCILHGVSPDLIERVVFSTTVITNLIAEKKYDPVGLIIIPGPGLSHDHYRFATQTHIVSGAIDYRGREIIPLDLKQVEQAVEQLEAAGYNKVAVVGKFSSRNNKHEKEIEKYIKLLHPQWQVELGHMVAGQLNFPRRIVSTMLTCATRDKYEFFVRSVFQALEQRGLKAEIYILRADGGTMRLKNSIRSPIETIFSGPAASTLGVQALLPPDETAVVVDIGGTTSDLALLLSGQPLLATRGVCIYNQLTHVRALAVKSVPVGGDTTLGRQESRIVLQSGRQGPPFCLGGPAPTPTDALRVLGLFHRGDYDRACQAMYQLGDGLNLSCTEIAVRVVDLVVDTIVQEINEMFKSWEQEPSYRVWEVLQKKKVRPTTVVGVGGGASGLIAQIASRMNCQPVLPPYASVANAIGAAVARPTLRVSLRADTQQGIYTIQEEGFQGKIEESNFNEEKAVALARTWLQRRVENAGLSGSLGEIEIIRREVFNVVRNWVTCGKIFDIGVQTQRGILHYVGGGGR